MKNSILIILICVCFSFGCSSKTKLSGLVPASGEILLDGAPLSEAVISLSPRSAGGDARAASAQSDASGRFTFSTLKSNDGVFPGEYVVLVSKYEDPPASTEESTKEFTAKSLIPKRYSEPSQTDQMLAIPPTGNKAIKIELSSK